jgi:Asp/Glu/hydantoin racemase
MLTNGRDVLAEGLLVAKIVFVMINHHLREKWTKTIISCFQDPVCMVRQPGISFKF